MGRDTGPNDAPGNAAAHRGLTVMLLAAALSMMLAVGPARAQSPAPTGAGGSTAPCGDDHRNEMTLGSNSIGARAIQDRGSVPFRDLDGPGGLGEAFVVDVLGGTELPVSLSSDDAPLAPVTAVVAVLMLDDREPVWLGPYGPDHPSVTVPLGAVGDGVIHVLAGTCDDWTFSGSWPITIADPAAAADCPTDLEGLHDWLDASDQQVLVGGTPVGSLGARGGVVGRYVPVSDDVGSYAGYEITGHERPIRLRAGRRFTVRAHDPSVEVRSAWARFAARPSDGAVRAGWVEELPPPVVDGKAELDGKGGVTVLAPGKPGRYLLVLDPVWRTTCLTTQDAQLVLTVIVR